MAKVKQLTVSHENRPGTLAHVAKVLGDAKVNILHYVTTTSGAEGATHVGVDNLNKAKKALDYAGLFYAESDVLQVELAKNPEHWVHSRASSPQRTSTSPSVTRPPSRAQRGRA